MATANIKLPQLPSEIWVHVFGYLPTADKLNIRTCCRYFKKLVDHRSLWKDWTVVLSFRKGNYNAPFWSTLRRRKTESALVYSVKSKDWNELARCLPTLTTIAMNNVSKESICALNKFTKLKRLAIRGKHTFLTNNVASILPQSQQLTHLHLCDADLYPTKAAFIANVSQFTNLTSLVYHPVGGNYMTFDLIIACLPKLKHLSWLMHYGYRTLSQKPPGGINPQVNGLGLSSLELVEYVNPSLSEDAMKITPGLQSLALFYKCHAAKEVPESEHHQCHLKTWLSDLYQLSTLTVVKGPPLHMFADSIPVTVTSLSLCVQYRLKDLEAVARRVPGLLHLHLDMWPRDTGRTDAQIPQLFPHLRSLKIRHQNISEKDFLSIRHLRNLERLEILDAHTGPTPHLSELICKLHNLTNYSIHVITFRQQRDPLACSCNHRGY